MMISPLLVVLLLDDVEELLGLDMGRASKKSRFFSTPMIW